MAAAVQRKGICNDRVVSRWVPAYLLLLKENGRYTALRSHPMGGTVNQIAQKAHRQTEDAIDGPFHLLHQQTQIWVF